MGTKKESFLNNRGKRILIIILAFFLLYFVSYVIDPYSLYWKIYFQRGALEILGEWAITFIFYFFVSEISIVINNKLNNYISWTERPSFRLIAETCLNLITILIINLVINYVFHFLFDYNQLSEVKVMSLEETRGAIQWIVVSTIIAIMIMGINIGNHLLLNWKNEAIRSTELNQVAMEAELQSLKLQIDPHFVFNNLSVLSELILEDQQLGFEYAENFSKIYRYMLINAKKDVIPLEDELKFLNSYLFLIKHRFGEGVCFEIDVNNQLRNHYLPPLTLQLLVENALKHNKTNKKDPLKVKVYTSEQNDLIVENVLQPIEKSVETSGLGIRNINRRYSLLSEKEPTVLKDHHSFKIILPLIKR